MQLAAVLKESEKAQQLGIKLHTLNSLGENSSDQIKKILKQGSILPKVTKPSNVSVLVVPPKVKAELAVTNVSATTVFVIGKQSDVTIIDQTTAKNKHTAILAHAGAICSYVNHQEIKQQDTTSKYDIYLQADSAIELGLSHLIHGTSHLDITCHHQSSRSSAKVTSLLKLVGKSTSTVNTTNHHKKENTYGDITVKALGQDASKSVINGMIKIDKQAKNTNSYLTQDILMLSPQSAIKAIPNLEIINNQVKASHSATVGRLSKSALYYLMSRGLNQQEAINLLISGFFIPAITQLQKPAAREYLKQFV